MGRDEVTKQMQRKCRFPNRRREGLPKAFQYSTRKEGLGVNSDREVLDCGGGMGLSGLCSLVSLAESR